MLIVSLRKEIRLDASCKLSKYCKQNVGVLKWGASNEYPQHVFMKNGNFIVMADHSYL